MAKLVGRYLANHKEVIDDLKRRTGLVDAAEIFVAAGWPAVPPPFLLPPRLQ